MNDNAREKPVKLFSTCPQSAGQDGAEYYRRVIDVAQWSDRYGCEGILVYTDNGLVDPWLVAQLILENTSKLCPLVAVQPIYLHPYAVAKMVASLAFLHSRRLYLNMVAGGFGNDLANLNDLTPHDRRYDRLVEYTTIIRRLLAGETAVSFAGDFYAVKNLRMQPPLPARLFPGIMISGSSDAGIAAAAAIDAIAVRYPEPPSAETPVAPERSLETGVRVGIIARPTEDAAWAVALERFPEDRKGQIAHQLAMKTSDSAWHKKLSDLAAVVEASPERSPYWLTPFQNYKTFCPYLVGSYDAVAAELSRYIGLGHRAFIVDIPPNEEELEHMAAAFDRATAGVPA